MKEASASENRRVLFHGLAVGGEAVGKEIVEGVAGRTVFAPGGAPDEEALVHLETEQKNFSRGTILNVASPSVYRVTAPCPYFGVVETPIQKSHFRPETGCGGCQWQHIEYSFQREAKRNSVVQSLRRVAGLGDLANSLVEECVASPHEFGYRNKADFVVAAPHRGARIMTQIGFVRRESHVVVDIERCPIQSESNNALLKLLREAVDAGLFFAESVASDKSDEHLLQRVVVRTSSRGESLLVVQTSREVWPQAQEFAAFLMSRAPHLRGVLQRYNKKTHHIAGADWLEEDVLDINLRVWGDDFFQINTTLTPTLLQTALNLCEIRPEERVLDLFCGVGLFAIGLAKRGARVIGIEGNARATEYAKINAQLNGVEAEFLAGDSAKTLRRRRQQWSERSRHTGPDSRLEARLADVVLLDPPRAGARECLAELVAIKPRRIVYVSCDPATLARDIKTLSSVGYVLSRAVPLDLFPQTAHVETVAQLDAI